MPTSYCHCVCMYDTIDYVLYMFLPADSVLAFKKRMKLGRFAKGNPEAQAEAEEREKQEKASVEAVPVGSRCEVTLPGIAPRRGTVMFVGELLLAACVYISMCFACAPAHVFVVHYSLHRVPVYLPTYITLLFS